MTVRRPLTCRPITARACSMLAWKRYSSSSPACGRDAGHAAGCCRLAGLGRDRGDLPVPALPRSASFSSRSPSRHQGCPVFRQQRGGVLAAAGQAQRHHPEVHHLLLQPRLGAAGTGRGWGRGWGIARVCRGNAELAEQEREGGLMPGGGGGSKGPLGQVHALQSCQGTRGHSASGHSPIVYPFPSSSISPAQRSLRKGADASS